jgi:hypothetical protein
LRGDKRTSDPSSPDRAPDLDVKQRGARSTPRSTRRPMAVMAFVSAAPPAALRGAAGSIKTKQQSRFRSPSVGVCRGRNSGYAKPSSTRHGSGSVPVFVSKRRQPLVLQKGGTQVHYGQTPRTHRGTGHRLRALRNSFDASDITIEGCDLTPQSR